MSVPAGHQPDREIPYVAFAGLGRPQKFLRTLEGLNLTVAGWHEFPDHYPYNAGDLAKLKAEARQKKARLITTEKDLVRIKSLHPSLAADILSVPVCVIWEDEKTLLTFLRSYFPEADKPCI